MQVQEIGLEVDGKMEKLTETMNNALDAMRSEADVAATATTKEIGVAKDAAVKAASKDLDEGS